ncbi:hypothetical protein C8Q76DRAFT_616444, partial [Earliella scabrosa]
LGYVYHLAHRGQRCPQAPTVSQPTPLVVTHINGIHELNIEECHCAQRPDLPEQLLRVDLFPATWDQPASAFTFEVLEDCHEDALASKKSAYDYIKKLRRRTNNSDEATRAGQCHGVVYPNRDPRLLTVPCFACPWPGVNLPPDWDKEKPELRYIYRAFFGADGNHSLQKKTKPGDDTDYSLVGENGFFQDIKKLDGFIEKYPKDTAKVVETCSGFKVTRSQRTGKFRFLDISGVVAVTCIRHGCFISRAVVNLPAGEQFALVDLAMSGALESVSKLLEWILTYDVGCSYIAGILSRWKEWNLPPDLYDVVQRLRILLPQLHMLAHKESCQCEYALCYKQGTGHSNGESVEALWAEHNSVGLSTREMNGGARLDALNDYFNSWNWRKNEGRGKLIARKLREKLPVQASQTLDLGTLTKEAGPALITKWSALDIDDAAPTPLSYPERRKRNVPSVYALDDTHVPSKGKALDQLMKKAVGLSSQFLEDIMGPVPAVKPRKKKKPTRASGKKRKRPTAPTSTDPPLSAAPPAESSDPPAQGVQEAPDPETRCEPDRQPPVPERYGQMLVALQNGIELEYAQ